VRKSLEIRLDILQNKILEISHQARIIFRGVKYQPRSLGVPESSSRQEFFSIFDHGGEIPFEIFKRGVVQLSLDYSEIFVLFIYAPALLLQPFVYLDCFNKRLVFEILGKLSKFPSADGLEDRNLHWFGSKQRGEMSFQQGVYLIGLGFVVPTVFVH